MIYHVSTGQACRSKRDRSELSDSDIEPTTETAQAMKYARVDDSEYEDPSETVVNQVRNLHTRYYDLERQPGRLCVCSLQ